ncbi:MAG TPA: DUF3147 family protein [Acidimicrobiales bacterium]|jgi:hypothetical protein
MNDVAMLAIKMANGGLFVVAFSLVAEALEPKRFAGLFSAAPSVALANLLVVLIVKGRPDGLASLSGMVVGAVAMATVCLAGIRFLPRLGSKKGSVAICGGWAVMAFAGWWMLP